jgi:hypothetical protein
MTTAMPVPRADPALPPVAASAWAMHTFGGTALGDQRRTARLVRIAAALAAHPEQSLARSLGDPASAKAAYRFLHSATTSVETVTAAHRAQTLEAARAEPVVLLVQDTSELDYSRHPATRDLLPLGPGRPTGYLLQSVLAIRPPADEPGAGTVLGLAALEPQLRMPSPVGETRTERAQRPRESDVWLRQVETIGAPPPQTRWVHVGDRAADMLRFFQTAQAQGADVLVRISQNRKIARTDAVPGHLLPTARALAPGAQRTTLTLPTRGGVRGRTVTLAVSWGAVTLQPTWLRPARRAGEAPLPGWVVRVWEPDPPPGVDRLEWLLFTTVPTLTEGDAWERVRWYQQRWIVEEYHQALKTGCRIEAAQLRDRDALWTLLGICAPIAVRLLQLRRAARQTPEALATTIFAPLTVQIVAALTGKPADGMTGRTCWRLIARLGGHWGRKGDGEPGWRTIWYGWQKVQDVEIGVHLAPSLPTLD